jgi:hypothetical protein
VRAPSEPIYAPWLSPALRWVNARRVMMHELRGHPVMVEFWDFCRPNSLRTLSYLKAWHKRYAPRGLRVLGIHSPGFAPSHDPDAVSAAVARLGVSYPVAIDSELEVWREYGNLGWPARYLFDGESRLFEYHYGEGAYAESEAAICELLGLGPPPAFVPLRPEDAPGALLEVPVPGEELPGPYSGPYLAGGVWAVLEGHGTVRANGAEVAVEHPGAYELIRHERSTRGDLELVIGAGVICHAVCLTPGVA